VITKPINATLLAMIAPVHHNEAVKQRALEAIRPFLRPLEPPVD